MTKIFDGRWTSRQDEDFVVFLIGMRFNRLWKIHKWAPVFAAMPRMIAELERQPDLGFLGANVWFGRTTLMVQYWRSFDALESYARARDRLHLPAWAAFNRTVGANGDVGVFHETYQVRAGTYENVYANMPATLLGRVGELVPARGGFEGARTRMEMRPRAPAEA